MQLTVKKPFVPFLLEDIEQCISSRFEKQVLNHPDKLALLSTDSELTYAELNSRANSLAKSIIQKCGKTSEPVCVFLNPGAELVIAILAVLKSGKFFVPLDPTLPSGINNNILNATNQSILITDSGNNESAEKLNINEDQLLIYEKQNFKDNSENLLINIDPNNFAYIYFTSGSTGKPKGVVDSHRNVLHNIYRYTNALQVAADDRLTMIQSPVFSGIISSLFTALLNGATLLPFDFRKEGFSNLAKWLLQSRPTIYHSVPSIFRGLVETENYFPDVRIVRLEGDRANRMDIELFRNSFSKQCKLAHGLGATETGLSCQFILENNSPFSGETIPLGKSLPGIEIRIIDENGNVVANGDEGEIEIGSEFLASGYWQNEFLTQLKFRQDNFNLKKRWYRSGDLGYIDASGNIIYKGRKDQEYKINGQFINKDEIEKALLDLGLFKQVLIVTHKPADQDPRLIAYYISNDKKIMDIESIRNSLFQILSINEIPSFFISLEEFPLTEHGKIDNKRLPLPELEIKVLNQEIFSSDEKVVVDCWEEILNCNNAQRTDDFFQKGGNSLIAALFIAKLERKLNRNISASILLTNPVLYEFLFHLLKKDPTAAKESPLIPINKSGNRSPIFMIDWIGGKGWHYRKLVQLLGNDQPFYCIANCGMTDPWHENITLEDFAHEVIKMIQELKISGPIRLGGNCIGGAVAFEAARILEEKGITIEQLILISVSPREFSHFLPEGSTEIYERTFLNSQRKRRLKEVKQKGNIHLFRFSVEWVWNKIKNKFSVFTSKIQTDKNPGENGKSILPVNERLLQDYKPIKSKSPVLLLLSEKETYSYAPDAKKTWSGLADDLELHILPGSEREILGEPVVFNVAKILSERKNHPENQLNPTVYQ